MLALLQCLFISTTCLGSLSRLYRLQVTRPPELATEQLLRRLQEEQTELRSQMEQQTTLLRALQSGPARSGTGVVASAQLARDRAHQYQGK